MANFKNNNRTSEEEIIGGCGNSHPETDIPLTEEDFRMLKSEAIHAKQRLNAYNQSKNSRTDHTPPYVTYEPEELIYIPLVFHQFISPNPQPDWWAPADGVIMDSDTTYTDEFYAEVIEYLNSFMDGTHVPEGTIGAHIDHPDHGVESKIRFKIATHLPSTFVSKFLNINAAHYTGETTLEGIVSFNFTNASIEAAEASALALYTTAEAAKESKYQELLGEGNTPDEAAVLLEETQEYADYEQAEYINGLGGLMPCGTQGAIFTHDLSKLSSCTLNILHGHSVGNPVPNCDEAFCFYPETVITEYEWGSVEKSTCELDYNSPIGNISEAVDHGGMFDYANELGLWGNTLPVMNVWTTVGDAYQSSIFRGYGPSPGYTINGNVYMDDTDQFNKDSYLYAQILLHEFGHSLGLPHTFQGGSMTDMKDLTIPHMIFPLEDYTVFNTSGQYKNLIFHVGADYIENEMGTTILHGEVSGGITRADLFLAPYWDLASGDSSNTATASSHGPSGAMQHQVGVPINKLEGITGENMHLLCSVIDSPGVYQSSGGQGSALYLNSLEIGFSAVWDGGEYSITSGNYQSELALSLDPVSANDVVIPAGAMLTAHTAHQFRTLVLNSSHLDTAATLTMDILTPLVPESRVNYNLFGMNNTSYPGQATTLSGGIIFVTSLGDNIEIPFPHDSYSAIGSIAVAVRGGGVYKY